MTTDHIAPLRQALKIQAIKHGPNSAEVAHANCVLGGAYLEEDDRRSAEVCYARACEIFEHLGMLQDLETNMAILSDLRGESPSDLSGLTLSHFNVPVYVSPQEAAPEGDSGDKGSYVENVKSFLTDDDDKVEEQQELSPEEKKREQERRALDDSIAALLFEVGQLKKAGSTKTNRFADLLVELASLYSRKNLPQQMEQALVDALAVREVVYGAGHLSVSTDLKNLGRVYFATEKYPEAERSWKRALEIREAVLGPFHPQVADIADLYAKLLRKVDRIQEAEDLENRIEESRSRHHSDWEAYRKTAVKAMEMDNFFYAQALWLAAMDEASEFEETDPRVLTTLENLAHVYWKRKKFEKSEPLCQRILKMSRQLLGQDHLDVARAGNNLALVCERTGRYQEAAVLYQEVVRVMELNLGSDHPDVVATRESHGNAVKQVHKQLEQKLQKAKF